jgi:hypothetical protein
MTTTSGIVANIQIGVNLIDDYLYLAESPVAQDLSGCFVTVQNPNTTATGTGQSSELLTVDGQGELVHYQPDKSSNSGWSKTVVPCSPPSYAPDLSSTAAVIRRLVGFYDAEGVLNVLVYYDNAETSGASCATWMQRSTSGEWSPATLGGNAENALGCTYQTNLFTDSDGNHYLYGVTANIGGGAFFMVAFDDSNESWEVIYSQDLDEFSGNLPLEAAFQMAQGSGASGAVVILWVADDQIYYRDASITVGKLETTFQWTEATQPPYNPGIGTLTVQDVYALPAAYGENNLLLCDASGTLYLVQGYNEQNVSLLALTGTQTSQPEGVAAVAAGVDSRGFLTIFGIDQDSDNLWYLQQQGTAAQLDPTGWVNLGGTNLTIGCPTSMKVGPELFAVMQAQAGPTVYHLDQSLPAQSQNGSSDQSTQVWSIREVAEPAPSSSDPTNIASYSMELSLFDADGNPVGATTDHPNGVPVTVTADQATTIVCNGIAYHTDPSQSVTIVTDVGGQASVLYQAVSLKPPVITFLVENPDQSTASRWCQGDIVEVQTDETQLTPAPGAVAPTLQTVSGQTLIDQNLTGSDYANTTAADNAAAAINSSGGWMVTNGQDPDGTGSIDLSAVNVPHWHLDFTHPDGPRFRVLTADEARSLLAKAQDPSTPPLLGGTLGNVFGDVAHFFKHEWQKLDSFAATVDQDVLTVVLTAEEGVQSFVISTVKQAGAALETIFSKIKEVADDIYSVIEEVIAWLKMLFEWQDILNTHKIIKSSINQTFANINNSLDYAQEQVSEKFGTVVTDVKDFFQNLESYFEPGQTYNQFANGLPPPSAASGGNVLAGTTTTQSQQQYASKTNYVYSRAQPSFATATAASGLAADPESSDPTTVITNAVQQYLYGDTFNQYTQTLWSFLTSAITSPSNLFDVVILDLLQAAQDLVIFVIEAIEQVINATLSIAADALGALSGLLNVNLDIPIISWLYKYVITGTIENPGDNLTLLDLMCLLLAVPVTILYKLVYGNGQAPFSSTDVTTVQDGLPWPTIPATMASELSSDPATTSLPPDTVETLGICAGLMLFINGTLILPSADTLAAQSDGLAAPNPLATFYSWASILLRTYICGAAAPFGAIAKSPQDWTNADQWTLVLWQSRMFALLVDTCYTALSPSQAGAKWTQVVGPTTKTAMGICLAGVGGVAGYYQLKDSPYTGWNAANSWIRPLPSVFKFLLYLGEGSIPWLPGIDVCAGIGASATQIGAAVEG